jgi:hypothetical protein
MHGVNEAFGVSDRAVARILGYRNWPSGDIQAWDCEEKNLFMADYIAQMPEDSRVDLLVDSARCMDADETSLLFSDRMEFARALSGHVYLEVEPDLSRQIRRARKLIEEKAA